MKIQENISLKPYNTFGIDKKARFFAIASSIDDFRQAISFAEKNGIELFVLGGGSNILLTSDQDKLVVKNELKGIKVTGSDEDFVWVKVGAGEIWHDLVRYAISQNWGGIENLSLIPGTVGASPMQNIGAYGVEIKDVFDNLEALHRKSGEIHQFQSPDCEFGYRESVFKHRLKNQYIITSVTFKLSKKPQLNTAYGAIQETLKAMNTEIPTVKAISDAVIHIRLSKLPDPAKIGNAGSFFKNPTISSAQFEELQSNFPSIPGYPNKEGVKVPAGWLIEQAGWKGRKFGEVGVHDKQALVLVNYGNGDGAAIEELSKKIQKSVEEKFGIKLSPEVNFL
ncbi:UDP-N-acetylmuramate dehydrogenase [Algoriphagus hitonicola]|uniref:UDP-N-acetylenolpyruvoylglucosamine reductase n=1 Tax=Algoriphagus hitonicola TaxID=435880 RepID=A0A1I2R9C9_9BACT|nr:UDP-N-acetylmuramate dehydrogenase [Algoriphagus hitonicola]SFG35197.1 UDP-N-acetylmuramate dehydrogenase [Algoriphagus hitonicola]